MLADSVSGLSDAFMEQATLMLAMQRENNAFLDLTVPLLEDIALDCKQGAC